MESNCDDVHRSASPSTFTLFKGRNNRLSILSARSLADRTTSPPPSYDGLAGLPNGAQMLPANNEARADQDVSAALDAHLPLTISNKGWSEVESVSKQFLLENLPGWLASMPEPSGDRKRPATQQKPLSQLIKAGVRKSHKGLVLRLLRRTQDADEIADLRLGTTAVKDEPAVDEGLAELPELDATPAARVVHQVPGIHEAPTEPPVYELPTTVTLMPRQGEPPSNKQADEQASTPQAEQDDEIVFQLSPTESLLRTLSFGPEEASAWSEPVIDTSDSDHSALSSIVPTPTKGLSVRHFSHKVIKRSQPHDADPAGGASGSRMLPLDMESLNRRLLESSGKTVGKDETDEEGGKESSPEFEGRGPSFASHETEKSQEAKVSTEQAPSVEGVSSACRLDPGDDPRGFSASGPITNSSEPLGADARSTPTHRRPGSADHLTVETAASKPESTSGTSRGASAQERVDAKACLQVPGAPEKLRISTNCGTGSAGAVSTSSAAPSPAHGAVARRHSPQLPQNEAQRPQSASQFGENESVLPAASRMHEPGDESQGTFDGSVTLPTLNIPEPDSPGDNLWLPSNIEIRPSPEKRSPLCSLLSHASKAIISQIGRVATGLYDAYGPEKPVPKDHVRVRWTCTCGKQLHDDFIERRRGAARELEAYLNRPRAHTSPHMSPSHRSNSSAHSSFSDPGQVFSANASQTPSPATTWGSLGGGGDASPSSGYSPTALRRSNNPFSVRVGALPPTRWLLTCADEGQFTTKLSHVDATETRIRSDRDLAMAVSGLYQHVNRKWWRLLRLRGLTSIEFVQFEVHRNRVVDIRKCPDMPPSKVHGQAYDFEPHDLVPPVGAQYLMHLFQHPEDYDGEVITYARAPKKRNARLDVGVGWGINLVEGFLPDRVWMLVMGFFVVGSSVFAVVWACRREGDVQGAFGVASWMLTLAVLLVGWAQAALG